MSALAERMTSEHAVTEYTPTPGGSERRVEDIRAEFLEMPGLSLTLAQAARLFGTDIRHSKRLLKGLVAEGFLVRDARGAFRRRDVSGKAEGTAEKQTRSSRSEPHTEDITDPSATRSMQSHGDVLEAMAVELPCLACDRSYRVSLRKIRLSHAMMDAGCQVRHFADCPPGAFAHLIDPTVLADFEEAVESIEVAAEGAGGRLVGPR